MKSLPFKTSRIASIGLELEFQIIKPNSFALISRSKELLRSIRESKYKALIKPEVTQSMIEINSSVHDSVSNLLEEIKNIQSFLVEQASAIHILFCGGGTHPFEKWSRQKIFPLARYKNLAHHYRYLSKRSTVFGMHVHIGCKNSDDALYLTHALTRYAPHFIAMSAASPFYQGIDTGFDSTRLTIFSNFPSSGVIPYLLTWNEFSEYFYKMRNLKIISSMKDFYWDIRPKPEFGTVEVRVCDTPLTLEKAALITAYIQALSLYLMEKKTVVITPDLYYLYCYNRFQACRYGLHGNIYDPETCKQVAMIDDIFETIKKIERHANTLGNMPYVSKLMDELIKKRNDASLLRQLFKQTNSLSKVVDEQCRIWQQPESPP